jgi:hypothetical protein
VVRLVRAFLSPFREEEGDPLNKRVHMILPLTALVIGRQGNPLDAPLNNSGVRYSEQTARVINAHRLMTLPLTPDQPAQLFGLREPTNFSLPTSNRS